jgi:hypothetical protein
MNREYWKVVEQSLEMLKAATGQAWELENTGGGHTAFVLNLPNGYYMITNDAGAPVTGEWDDITFGWYETDEVKFPYGDEGTILDTVTTLDQLVAWAGK